MSSGSERSVTQMLGVIDDFIKETFEADKLKENILISLKNTTKNIKKHGKSYWHLLTPITRCVGNILATTKDLNDVKPHMRDLTMILKECLKKCKGLDLNHVSLIKKEKLLSRLIEEIQLMIQIRPKIKYSILKPLFEPLVELVTSSLLSTENLVDLIGTLNCLMCGVNGESRIAIREAHSLLVEGLVIRLAVCGDYEVQQGITELLLRLAPTRQRDQMGYDWFQSNHELADLFGQLGTIDFEAECRSFLNLLNSGLKDDARVVTVPCETVIIGQNKVHKPKNTNYKTLYVDFNLGSSSLSFCYALSESEVSMLRVKDSDLKQASLLSLDASLLQLTLQLSCKLPQLDNTMFAGETFVRIVFKSKFTDIPPLLVTIYSLKIEIPSTLFESEPTTSQTLNKRKKRKVSEGILLKSMCGSSFPSTHESDSEQSTVNDVPLLSRDPADIPECDEVMPHKNEDKEKQIGSKKTRPPTPGHALLIASCPKTPGLPTCEATYPQTPRLHKLKSSCPQTPGPPVHAAVRSQTPEPSKIRPTRALTPGPPVHAAVRSQTPEPSKIRPTRALTPGIPTREAVRPQTPGPSKIRATSSQTPGIPTQEAVRPQTPGPSKIRATSSQTPGIPTQEAVRPQTPGLPKIISDGHNEITKGSILTNEATSKSFVTNPFHKSVTSALTPQSPSTSTQHVSPNPAQDAEEVTSDQLPSLDKPDENKPCSPTPLPTVKEFANETTADQEITQITVPRTRSGKVFDPPEKKVARRGRPRKNKDVVNSSQAIDANVENNSTKKSILAKQQNNKLQKLTLNKNLHKEDKNKPTTKVIEVEIQNGKPKVTNKENTKDPKDEEVQAVTVEKCDEVPKNTQPEAVSEPITNTSVSLHLKDLDRTRPTKQTRAHVSPDRGTEKAALPENKTSVQTENSVVQLFQDPAPSKLRLSRPKLRRSKKQSDLPHLIFMNSEQKSLTPYIKRGATPQKRKLFNPATPANHAQKNEPDNLGIDSNFSISPPTEDSNKHHQNNFCTMNFNQTFKVQNSVRVEVQMFPNSSFNTSTTSHTKQGPTTVYSDFDEFEKGDINQWNQSKKAAPAKSYQNIRKICEEKKQKSQKNGKKIQSTNNFKDDHQKAKHIRNYVDKTAIASTLKQLKNAKNPKTGKATGNAKSAIAKSRITKWPCKDDTEVLRASSRKDNSLLYNLEKLWSGDYDDLPDLVVEKVNQPTGPYRVSTPSFLKQKFSSASSAGDTQVFQLNGMSKKATEPTVNKQVSPVEQSPSEELLVPNWPEELPPEEIPEIPEKSRLDKIQQKTYSNHKSKKLSMENHSAHQKQESKTNQLNSNAGKINADISKPKQLPESKAANENKLADESKSMTASGKCETVQPGMKLPKKRKFFSSEESVWSKLSKNNKESDLNPVSLQNEVPPCKQMKTSVCETSAKNQIITQIKKQETVGTNKKKIVKEKETINNNTKFDTAAKEKPNKKENEIVQLSTKFNTAGTKEKQANKETENVCINTKSGIAVKVYGNKEKENVQIDTEHNTADKEKQFARKKTNDNNTKPRVAIKPDTNKEKENVQFDTHAANKEKQASKEKTNDNKTKPGTAIKEHGNKEKEDVQINTKCNAANKEKQANGKKSNSINTKSLNLMKEMQKDRKKQTASTETSTKFFKSQKQKESVDTQNKIEIETTENESCIDMEPELSFGDKIRNIVKKKKEACRSKVTEENPKKEIPKKGLPKIEVSLKHSQKLNESEISELLMEEICSANDEPTCEVNKVDSPGLPLLTAQQPYSTPKTVISESSTVVESSQSLVENTQQEPPATMPFQQLMQDFAARKTNKKLCQIIANTSTPPRTKNRNLVDIMKESSLSSSESNFKYSPPRMSQKKDTSTRLSRAAKKRQRRRWLTPGSDSDSEESELQNTCKRKCRSKLPEIFVVAKKKKVVKHKPRASFEPRLSSTALEDSRPVHSNKKKKLDLGVSLSPIKKVTTEEYSDDEQQAVMNMTLDVDQIEEELDTDWQPKININTSYTDKLINLAEKWTHDNFTKPCKQRCELIKNFIIVLDKESEEAEKKLEEMNEVLATQFEAVNAISRNFSKMNTLLDQQYTSDTIVLMQAREVKKRLESIKQNLSDQTKKLVDLAEPLKKEEEQMEIQKLITSLRREITKML